MDSTYVSNAGRHVATSSYEHINGINQYRYTLKTTGTKSNYSAGTYLAGTSVEAQYGQTISKSFTITTQYSKVTWEYTYLIN